MENKKTDLFKNKKQKILYLISFVLMLIAFIYLGTTTSFNDLNHAEKFSDEFNLVSTDNVFIYKNANEVVNLIKKDGIILFGTTMNSEWTGYLAKYINEVALDSEISEVYYYDYYLDRLNNNGNYELIVEYLHDYLFTNDLGETEIYGPSLFVIKNGKVIYYFDDTTFVRGSVSINDYWSTVTRSYFKNDFYNAINIYIGDYDE